MKSKIILITSICIFAHLHICTFANNLNITGTSVAGSTLTFKINWDNSWYAAAAPFNWDAVWVFVKYKDCSTSNWQHASLSTNAVDHSVAGGVLQVDAVTDGKGVFIRRKATGSGKIDTSLVTLKISTPASGTYNFRVFGVEMVRILKESFLVGDGASTNTFKSINIDSTAQASGLAATALYAGYPALPATYPMGWNAFYCMKYEITQQQYVDFLNTLTYDQQENRSAVLPNIAATNWAMGGSVGTTGRGRNGIKIKTAGVASVTPAEFACDLNNNGTGAGANFNDASDGQNIPCNYINWSDISAYLDWACLRPMTDPEFEKVCRGVSGRVANEYPWGTTQLKLAAIVTGSCWSYTLVSNQGATNEMSGTSGDGLCAYGYTSVPTYGLAVYDIANNTVGGGGCGLNSVYTGGPLRAGFAATASTNRFTAGASYYGVMEMAGNLWERVVTVDSAGYSFKGTLGDGALTTTGNATNTDWPGIDVTPANGITGAKGSGSRGGSWYTNSSGQLHTSDRTYAATINTNRTCEHGGRGVR